MWALAGIFALRGLTRAPLIQHHRYAEPVRQQNTTVPSTAEGLVARTRNELR